MAQVPELVHTLTQGLRQGTYECAICTDLIASLDPRWSCRHCYGVFHLPCVTFWAQSQVDQLTKERRGDEVRSGGGLRFSCPLCQCKNAVEDTKEYVCFCGKVPSPKYDAMLVPGACGQTCDKAHSDPECTHNCTLACHPGPCPECPRTRLTYCYCGTSERTVGCSSNIHGFSCGEVCGKELPCGRHYCEDACHSGPCKPCRHVRTERCYCGTSEREGPCKLKSGYSCGGVCGRAKDCGVHHCTRRCHDGPCDGCDRLPTRQKTCPCGKAQLWEIRLRQKGNEKDGKEDAMGKAGGAEEDAAGLRTKCTDKIPTCGQTCELPLRCGEHFCTFPCHDSEYERSHSGSGATGTGGASTSTCTTAAASSTEATTSASASASASAAAASSSSSSAAVATNPFARPSAEDNCPPCTALVTIVCSCGATKKKDQPCFVTYLPKAEWLPLAQQRALPKEVVKGMVREYPFKCDRRCNSLLSCGKHKCEEVCCDNEGHICMRTCHKKAPCGIHECGQLCHPGPCPPCANIGVDPLYCRCRKSVIDPPVPCGTKPPRCNHPCIIPRPCGHRANHNCHFDGDCPPCTESVPKTCASHGTKMPFNQPCYLPYVSCGRKCLKALTCCGKACEMICHAGPCTHKCTQSFPDLLGGGAGGAAAASAGGKKAAKK